MFLGHQVGGGQIRMDMDKVRAIHEWQPPTTERVALIPWARELLSEIYRGILEEGRTTDRLIEEGTTLVLDKGMPKGH